MAAEVEERVGYQLKRAQAALRGAMDRALEVRGLTTPQYAVLSQLEREPGLSNAELARRSFVTAQTMQRIVENLAAAGHVERTASAEHGRVLETTLTARGRRTVAGCHAVVGEIEARMLGALGHTQRRQLASMLEACAEALDG